mmetsp:Transcript_24060/g.58004  ORF Transcript_24060/g.58004 Transcript_24060/m.58004 type:complete len:458 (-) Transcript_24060:29-1402(-)
MLLEELHRCTHAVFLYHLSTDRFRLRLDPCICRRTDDHLSELLRAQLAERSVAKQTKRADPRTVLRLVTEDGSDDGGAAGAQRCRGGTGAAVVHNAGALREEPLVRRGAHEEHMLLGVGDESLLDGGRVFLERLEAQPAAARAREDDRAHACMLDGADCHRAHEGVGLAQHRAPADVHRRPLGEEAFELVHRLFPAKVARANLRLGCDDPRASDKHLPRQPSRRVVLPHERRHADQVRVLDLRVDTHLHLEIIEAERVVRVCAWTQRPLDDLPFPLGDEVPDHQRQDVPRPAAVELARQPRHPGGRRVRVGSHVDLQVGGQDVDAVADRRHRREAHHAVSVQQQPRLPHAEHLVQLDDPLAEVGLRELADVAQHLRRVALGHGLLVLGVRRPQLVRVVDRLERHPLCLHEGGVVLVAQHEHVDVRALEAHREGNERLRVAAGAHPHDPDLLALGASL